MSKAFSQIEQALAKTQKFSFSKENLSKIEGIKAKYPIGKSEGALVETLLLAQKQNKGWLSPLALETVAKTLEVPLMKVLEIAHFYPLLNVTLVGTHCVRICTTASCWLKGSTDLGRACQKWLGVGWEETTIDEMFSLKESACLGDCTKAPVIQINETLHGKLTPREIIHLLQELAEGEKK